MCGGGKRKEKVKRIDSLWAVNHRLGGIQSGARPIRGAERRRSTKRKVARGGGYRRFSNRRRSFGHSIIGSFLKRNSGNRQLDSDLLGKRRGGRRWKNSVPPSLGQKWGENLRKERYWAVFLEKG